MAKRKRKKKKSKGDNPPPAANTVRFLIFLTIGLILLVIFMYFAMTRGNYVM